MVSPNANPAYATLTDDRFDGNIFALYGGNGSLVPPRVTLAQSFQLGRPALIVFYVDDSSDCKLYTPVLNQVQAFYSRFLSIIPIAVDSIDPSKTSFTPIEEGYYYRGFVPQTVLISAEGKVLMDREGKINFDTIDTALHQIADLPLPPANMKMRNPDVKQINEINP